MRVEAIPNRGPASMGPELADALDWASSADIASAFVTSSALDRIEDGLVEAQNAHRRLRVRLITGLYRRFTSAAALKKTLQLQNSYPDRFQVRIALNERFHWKLYIFRRAVNYRLYVGSANFTDDGLTASGELSIKITARVSNAIAKSLLDEFDALWLSEEESTSPSKRLVEKYSKLEDRHE